MCPFLNSKDKTVFKADAFIWLFAIMEYIKNVLDKTLMIFLYIL